MLLKKPASAGPAAIPSALALTNAAEALVSCFTGTWSEMYRRLIALAPPNLQQDKPQHNTNISLCEQSRLHQKRVCSK